MNFHGTTNVRPDPAGNAAESAISFDTFAALLRLLHKDDQVTLNLVNGTTANGFVDMASISGDVLWLHTPGGRRMFMLEDVRDLTWVTDGQATINQKS